MNKKDLKVSDATLNDIAVETQGYTGAEIEQNADEAAPETEESKEAEIPEDNQEEKTN